MGGKKDNILVLYIPLTLTPSPSGFQKLGSQPTIPLKTGLESRSRVFSAPWSRSRLKKTPGAGAAWKKSQEPEPLKIWAAPQPCEKIKSIRKLYFSYSFLGKILSFMVNILPRSRSRLMPEPLEKKYQEPEPEPLGKKIRSRSRSRSHLKKVRSQSR